MRGTRRTYAVDWSVFWREGATIAAETSELMCTPGDVSTATGTEGNYIKHDHLHFTTSFVTIADPFLLSSFKFYQVLLSSTELKTFNPTSTRSA
jgi:hypothetical protein